MQTAETRYLGLALLVAESEDGHCEPVGVVATLQEAREIAAFDFRARTGRLAAEDTPLCPHAYKVWAPGADGQYTSALEIRLDARQGEIYSAKCDGSGGLSVRLREGE